MSLSTRGAARSGSAGPAPGSPAPEPTAPAPAPAAPADSVRRQELAAFLRSRRERIPPERVGLPRGPRRRTPGLRREEVAHLSTVGVTWYTWLEQGRAIQVSAQVLDALARALMLDSSERAHLFALGGTADPTPAAETPVLPEGIRKVLDRLEPFPACVQNARYDIVAYNRVYGCLLGDLDAHPPEDRNCMWLAFTDPDWAAAMPDREEAIRLMVARFRSRMAEHLAEPAWKALLARMRTSAEFRALWERHEVVRAADHTKRFRNPRVGMVSFTYHGLWLGPAEGARLGTYVPRDEETQARVERLLGLVTAGR
ncbi:helix-turn-helix transcriptional regulator [Streptomyces sp. WMMB303]|uniref:helix-turn-helix transcriptional regulator n=1 Tax=Streptomyces sp. WMMB303 TaxID=3034154 RepID=UPI0023EC835A|nr:helix-turn-helix transcriptional regulator [Streptomyces sp. WMMB303]MDF4250541.1 helix-turn-helix transcriptional regulator [Streptomyces sp. WMMB303]